MPSVSARSTENSNPCSLARKIRFPPETIAAIELFKASSSETASAMACAV